MSLTVSPYLLIRCDKQTCAVALPASCHDGTADAVLVRSSFPPCAWLRRRSRGDHARECREKGALVEPLVAVLARGLDLKTRIDWSLLSEAAGREGGLAAPKARSAGRGAEVKREELEEDCWMLC